MNRTARQGTHAVKSALPDAARDASGLSFVLQTAPLCPTNVPTQSPVHSRSIGFPSLQLEIMRYVPSSWSAEKLRCVTGRVWPGATSGTGRDIVCRVFREVKAGRKKFTRKVDETDGRAEKGRICFETVRAAPWPLHFKVVGSSHT